MEHRSRSSRGSARWLALIGIGALVAAVSVTTLPPTEDEALSSDTHRASTQEVRPKVQVSSTTTSSSSPPAPVTTQPVTTTRVTVTPRSSTTHSVPASTPSGGHAPAAGTHDWDAVAQCESGGNWHINTGNGYYGGLQFSLSSWRYVGGTGYPHEHSRETQIHFAEILLAKQGRGAWPHCGKYL